MFSVKTLATSALVIAATCGVAAAQMTPTEILPEGRLYVFHSKAQGGCPELDWHIVVGHNNALSGMIGWDDMQHIARATGAYAPTSRTFEMNAKEVGGEAREAKITGSINALGWFIANIDGPGVKCSRVTVPFYSGTFAGGGSG